MTRREFLPAVAGFVTLPPAERKPSQDGSVPLRSSLPSFTPVDAVPLGKTPPGAVILHHHWHMREEAIVGNQGEEFSRARFSAIRDWYATTVPTTTLGTLIRHGLYPDPYVGLNNLQIPDASLDHSRRYHLDHYSHLPDGSNPWSQPYWFRTQFSLPESFQGKTVFLHFDGINYRADIWLNGERIATADQVAGMFRRFCFDVSRLVRSAELNALAVRIHPLDYPGDPAHEQIDGLLGGFGPNGGDGEILRNVTQYCTIGWDWVPASRDRNIGIWQHVWLEATGVVAVRDPAAFVERLSAENREALLTIKAQMQNTAPEAVTVDLRVRLEPDGFQGDSLDFRSRQTVSASTEQEITLHHGDHPELILHNPVLWWPVGYGAPALYRLTVEAWIDGQLSSSSASNVGIRTLGTYLLPSGGRAFTVNGRTIRLTGGAWVPDFLLSWSAQRYRDEVRLMAEGNHTVVRVNGCGIMPPDVFFDECDRRGLLVWQDFSRTSIAWEARKDKVHSNDPLPCEAALLLTNMEDCIMRLRSHPSLLLWCGCNEATPQADFGQPMQNQILPALDPLRLWLPSSGSDPSWEREPIRTWSGGPYELVPLARYFRLYETGTSFTCKNEIGLASPPPLNSLRRAIPSFRQPQAKAFPLNQAFGYHDATGPIYRATHNLIRSNIGEAACLNDYLWMADLWSSAAYRCIYEAANQARPRNAGTHLWKVNAAWPSMMWQLFDWYLRPNAGYYAMRSACQPLHVQYSLLDYSIQVVSTLPVVERGLLVTAAIYDLSGKLQYSREWSIEAAAETNTPVDALPSFVADGRLFFVSLRLLNAAGRELSRSVTWLQKDGNWQDLLQLPSVAVTTQVLEQAGDKTETVLRLAVHNTSPLPAVQIWLEILRGLGGEEVLPAFWSDNGFTLPPGEEREITVRFRSGLLRNAEPYLMSEGWNVRPQEIRLHGPQAVPRRLHVTGIEIKREGRLTQAVVRVRQAAPPGPRLTNWPLQIQVRGRLLRTIRLGLAANEEATARLTVDSSVTSREVTVMV